MRFYLWAYSYVIMIIFHILVMRKRIDLTALVRFPMIFGYISGMTMISYHYHNKILEVARVVPLSIVIVDTFVLIIKVFNEEDEYENEHGRKK